MPRSVAITSKRKRKVKERRICHICKRKPVRSRRDAICYCCKQRMWRKRNPIPAAYHRLKAKARARNIPFDLTLEQFAKFAVRHDYVNRTGNEAWCLTVDRKDNLLGYTETNIQPLTRSANSIKRIQQDELRMRHGLSWMNRT